MTTTCKIPSAKCMDDEVVKSVQNILDVAKRNPIMGGMLPLSENDIKITENALKKYEIDCMTCATNTGNDKNCMDAARVNLRRNLPFSANNIYPWRNYDWNYANAVSNKYSTDALPSSDSSTFDGLYNNGLNLVKNITGFILDPIPSSQASSTRMDENSDYPVAKCRGDVRCQGTERVRRNLTQRAPTDDNFLKKNLEGENSSSYYFKVGTCDRPDIITKEECENKKYKWTPNPLDNTKGYCTQPRYGFIDNTAKPFINGSNGKGFIPAIANDLFEIMPDKLLDTLLGQSTTGLQIQECPNIGSVNEGFGNYFDKMWIVLMISFIGLYISVKLRTK